MPKSDGSIEIDARISTENFKKNLKEMVTSAENSTDDIAEKGDKMFKAMQSARMKLAAEYKKAGMSQSEASKKAWAEVKKTAEYSSVMAAKEAAKASKQVQKSAAEASQSTQVSADKAGSTIKQILDEIAQKADETYGDVGKKGIDFADKIKGALTVAGITAGAAKIIKLGTDYEKSMNQVAASTGAAGRELENLQTIASNVYSNNFGESMEDAAAGISEVYKRTGLIDEELQKATESAFLLKDTFGYEVAESTQAATQLMKVFGVTAEEAYTLIAQGAQQGLDQNGDMLDTLNEYSVQFANLGYSAEDMFNMPKNGVDSGTWSVDKLGDAVKEMNIRLNDGTADKALESLGLNAESVKIKLSEGGETAQKAQQQILTSLMAVEDEQERYILGQTLMGTMWEDLGEEAVNALMNTSGEISKTSNALDKMSEVKYDDIGSRFEQLKRTAETEIIVPLTKEFMPVIEEIFSFAEDNSENIVNVIKPIGVALKGIFSIANAALKPVSALLSPILNLVGKFSGAIGDLFSYIAGSETEIENYSGTLSECRTEIEQTELALENAKRRYGENSDVVKDLESDLELLNKQYEQGGGYLAELNEQSDATSEAFKEMSKAQSDAMDAIDNTQVQGLRAVSMLESLSGKAQLTSADLDTMSKYADYLNDTFNCNIVVDYDKGEITGFDPEAVTQSIIDIANDNKVQQSIDFLTNPDFTSGYADSYKKYKELLQKKSNLQKEYDQRYKNADYDTFIYDDRFGEIERELALTSAELETATSSLNNYDAQLEEYGKIAEESGFSTELFRESLRETANSGDELIGVQEKANAKLSEQQQGIDAAKGIMENYTDRILEIAEAYDTARQAAYDSMSQQFGLFETAQMDAEATVSAFTVAGDSQANFWNQYSENLSKLETMSADSLGITEENFQLLKELALQTDQESISLFNNAMAQGDEGMAQLANTLGKVDEAKTEASEKVGEIGSGLNKAMAEIKEQIEADVEKLDMSDDAKDAAASTMDGYIDGLFDSIDNATQAAQSVVDAVQSVFDNANLTYTASGISGSVKIEGNARGTTNSSDIFIAGEEGPELIVGKGGSTVFPFSETAKIVNAVSSMIPGADSAVAATMNIMNAQGASSVSAASPVYREIFSPTPVSSAPVQLVSSPDLHPTFYVTVNLSNDEFRDYVIDTITSENANSGGWSV